MVETSYGDALSIVIMLKMYGFLLLLLLFFFSFSGRGG